MKSLNVKAILLLGGILLFALGFQIFLGYSVENFETASGSAPPASGTAPPASDALPASGAPPSSGTAPPSSGASPPASGASPPAPVVPSTDLGNVMAAKSLYTNMPVADKKILLNGVKSAIQLL